MEFKEGQKFNRVSNCLNEDCNGIIKILEVYPKSVKLVKTEKVMRQERLVEVSHEMIVGIDYLEDRINRGYIIKMKHG